MPRFARLPLLVAAGLALLLLAIWAAREPLSDAVVARWFAAQKVDARYRITALTPSGVTLADVSLGPAARPEFTAERVEARLGWSLLEPRVDRVRLIRPYLRATLSSTGISFGSLDRLLPAPGRPARPLPDIDVRIVDGGIGIATPAGPLSGRFAGQGRLRDGFDGTARIAPAQLAASGCAAALPGATLRLNTTRDAATVSANGTVPRLICGAWTAEAIGWNLIATLPPTLDRYTAKLTATTGSLDASGTRAASATMVADATASQLTGPVAGHFQLGSAQLRASGMAVRSAAASGSYRFDTISDIVSVDARASVAGASMTLPADRLRDLSRRAAGTLVQPLTERLIGRGQAAARSFGATAQVSASYGKGLWQADIDGVGAHAASGAKLIQSGKIVAAPGSIELAGTLSLSDGGLPSASLTGSAAWQNRALSGRATLAVPRWAVPGASIDALKLDAQSTGNGFMVEGGARVSGGLGGGLVVQRLGVPVALSFDRDGSMSFGPRCVAVDWNGMVRDTVRIAAGVLRLCPTGSAIVSLAKGRLGGGAVIDRPVLRGTSAGVPFGATGGAVRLAFSGTSGKPLLTLAPVRFDAAFGPRRGSATLDGRLDLASLSGSGNIAAASFDDSAQPVNIDAVAATWRLASGRLELASGTARIADRKKPARFEPLRLRAVAASLTGNRIEGRGSGSLATGPAKLFDFTATHDLATGRGSATAETGNLVFGPALQPYQITENLRGIVENVVGPVHGTGRFDWTADTLTSRGALRIDRLNLATAALGPVEGVDGTLVFDDLMLLTTPPGQTLRVARINPGVVVEDGVVVFRMLGPDAASIDSIVWPFAGGILKLAPVVIRAGDLRRDFLLAVDGLDAELFLQRFDLKNINVTGKFDGRLPLVFENGTGRIAAGRLVAQPGGGLVQYVGEIGGEDLGGGAKLAFDALRRLRYRELALDLDGALDGELVTQLRFSGTNEAVATLGGGPVPIKATGLPFKFNVTVRAPFAALLGTAASFNDVRPLIRPSAVQVQPQ